MDGRQHTLTIFFSKIKIKFFQIIEKVCDVNTVLLRTFATVLAVITLLLLLETPIGWVAGVAVFFGLAFCFKDYTEVTTSNHSGNQESVYSLSKHQKIKKILAIGLSVVCGIGLELLLFEGLVAFATTVIAPVSVGLSFAAIITTAVVVLFTLPNDILFYWNCIRKFFNLPSLSQPVQNKTKQNRHRVEFVYLVASCFTSSLMVLIGCVTTFVGIGTALGSVGMIGGLVLGSVLGILGLVGNFYLQMQSIKELKKQFAQDTEQSGLIQTLTTFNHLYLKKIIERLTASAMSLSYSVPIVQSIITSPIMKRFPLAVTVTLSGVAAVSVTVTVFKVGFNYIKRILVVRKDTRNIYSHSKEKIKQETVIQCLNQKKSAETIHGNNRRISNPGFFYTYQVASSAQDKANQVVSIKDKSHLISSPKLTT